MSNILLLLKQSTKTNNQHSKKRGFTLIELMVVVVIVGVISAIAFPSYVEYVRKSKRAEVRSALLENAQYMERFFTENSSYLKSPSGASPVLPNTVIPRGATGADINYNIAFGAAPALSVSAYILEATPANTMAIDPCAGFTLNNLGQKGSKGTLGTGKTTEICWK